MKPQVDRTEDKRPRSPRLATRGTLCFQTANACLPFSETNHLPALQAACGPLLAVGESGFCWEGFGPLAGASNSITLNIKSFKYRINRSGHISKEMPSHNQTLLIQGPSLLAGTNGLREIAGVAGIEFGAGRVKEGVQGSEVWV